MEIEQGTSFISNLQMCERHLEGEGALKQKPHFSNMGNYTTFNFTVFPLI